MPAYEHAFQAVHHGVAGPHDPLEVHEALVLRQLLAPAGSQQRPLRVSTDNLVLHCCAANEKACSLESDSFEHEYPSDSGTRLDSTRKRSAISRQGLLCSILGYV